VQSLGRMREEVPMLVHDGVVEKGSDA
jgi:hypothetical protein